MKNFKKFKNIFILAILAILAVSFFVYTDRKTEVDSPKAYFFQNKGNSKIRPVMADYKNTAVVLYSNKGNIVFEKSGAKKLIVGADQKTSKLWLAVENNNIYAIWWTKDQKNGKRLWLSASNNGGESFLEPKVINDRSDVLPSISIATKGDKVAIMYLDERLPGHQMYVNASNDGGKTWLKNDVRLDKTSGKGGAIDPNLLFVGGNIVAFWMQQEAENGKPTISEVSRASIDGGVTWGEEHAIFKSSNEFAIKISVDQLDDEVFISVFREKIGLKLYRTKDVLAKKWQESDVAPETENLSTMAWIRAKGDNTKFLISYIVEDKKTRKNKISVQGLVLATNQWDEKPYELSKSKHPYNTKAVYQDFQVSDSGVFIATWQDYRYLLPTIMLNYSNDGGVSWLPDPLFLSQPGAMQVRKPTLKIIKNKVEVFYEMVNLFDPSMSRSELVVSSGVIDKGNKLLMSKLYKETISENDATLKKSLAKREQELWAARLDNDWEKAWEYMDPLFKKITNKKRWLFSRGQVVYLKAKAEEVKVAKNLGQTSGKITITIPSQVIDGEIIEDSAAKETNYTMKWGWFYDNWYYIPGGLFKRHLTY